MVFRGSTFLAAGFGIAIEDLAALQVVADPVRIHIRRLRRQQSSFGGFPRPVMWWFRAAATTRKARAAGPGCARAASACWGFDVGPLSQRSSMRHFVGELPAFSGVALRPPRQPFEAAGRPMRVFEAVAEQAATDRGGGAVVAVDGVFVLMRQSWRC